MKINEKIRKIRKEKKLSLEALYQKLKLHFRERAIKPNTIWRIEQGLTQPRPWSLYQLSVGLEINLKELLKNTQDLSLLSENVELIRKNQRFDRYIYNPKAKAEFLTSLKRSFLIQELSLLPGGRTPPEKDPQELAKFQKWVYCLTGEVNCIIGDEQYLLKKGDCLSFESHILHHFENNSLRKAKILILQNPGHI